MNKPDASRIAKNIRKIIAAALLLVVLLALWNAYGEDLLKGDTLTATGTIEATTVKISSSLPGTVETIYFKEGDKVQKGDIVAEISRDDLAAQLAQNEAALEKAKIALSQVTSSAMIQQLSSAQAAVSAAHENLMKAEADYSRYSSLFEQGVAPQAEMERFRTAYEVAGDAYDSASAQLKALKSSGGVNAQIGSAQSDIEKASAAVDSVKAQLEDLTLESPISGVVTSRNFEEGEFAAAGGGIATVADLDNLWIRIYVTTEELPMVKLGETVKFNVSGYDQQFEGTVTYIADKGEYTPKTVLTENERANVVFAVKISTDSGGGVLKPGMPADVVF